MLLNDPLYNLTLYVNTNAIMEVDDT